MKRTILALIAVCAVTALAAACHEQRKGPTEEEAAPVRARAGAAQDELQQQTPPPSPDQGQ